MSSAFFTTDLFENREPNLLFLSSKPHSLIKRLAVFQALIFGAKPDPAGAFPQHQSRYQVQMGGK